MEFRDQIQQIKRRTDNLRTARNLRKAARENNGRLPKPIFEAVVAAVPGTALEVVPFHVSEQGNLQVFLTQRPANDKFWPNLWHCPGVMVVNGDTNDNNDFSKAWTRLKKTEFRRDDMQDITEVGTLYLNTKRGRETAAIHFTEVPNDLQGGSYFNVDDLPNDMVDHHLAIIEKALEVYNRLHERS